MPDPDQPDPPVRPARPRHPRGDVPPAARGPFGPFDRPCVETRHTDGRWYPGRLHGWVRGDDGWRAVVTYGTTPGVQYYGCVAASAVRPAGDDGPVARDAAHDDAQERGVSVPDPGVS